MPRPPETTTRAELRSGRSERAVSRPRKVARLAGSTAATVTISAAPPVSAAAGKAVVRTVITRLASVLFTVASALPA